MMALLSTRSSVIPSVRNSPWQSTNANAFAEAYLRSLVSASADILLRQLNDDDNDYSAEATE